MNSNVDCSACTDLKNNAPEFVQNGVTKTVCASLQNDTGLNPTLTTLHTDCEDLDTATDCMIGMMEKEVDSYDLCDWKDFMKKFINNLTQILKAIICAICGIWTNIHNLWDKTEELECIINFLGNGAAFSMGESTSGDAYAVAGKGVSFLLPHPGTWTTDLGLVYIAGGLMRGSGAFYFFNSDFTDDAECANFDTGSYRVSTSRLGNSWWGTQGRYAEGGELICEFRIKKSAYPQIKELFNGIGQESGGGAYHVQTICWDGDYEGYIYGQHGWCDNDGNPAQSGYSYGHKATKGWWYIQLRMTYCHDMEANGTQYTPWYFMGVRMNKDKIEC